jgi:sirohydrochlorin cobaltochelatase
MSNVKRNVQGGAGATSAGKAPLSSLLSPLPALILFAHGARDPDWSIPFRDIQLRLQSRRPGLAVELAYLEIMQPTLPEAAAKLATAGCRHILIAPLFMGQGGHLKRDLPRLIDDMRQRHPNVAFELLPAAGDVDRVREAISGWLADTAPQDVPA